MDYNNFFKDYNIKDFKNESLDKKLEILSTAVNNIPRALAFLAMKNGKIYYNGQMILEDVLSYLNISKDILRDKEEKRKYKDIIPIDGKAYWSYVDYGKNQGVLTKINLFAKVEISPLEIGYTLTSFGESIKGFISYLLNQFANIDINPWNLFGRTAENNGKRSPRIALYILTYLNSIYLDNKKSTNISNIMKEIKMGERSILDHLKRFEDLGLVEYIGKVSRDEKKIYYVDKEMSKHILENFETYYKAYKGKIKGNKGSTYKVLEYIIQNDFDKVTKEDLKKLGYAEDTIGDSLLNLKKMGALKNNNRAKREYNIVKPTEKLHRLYENIIKPIIDISNNPDKIIEYSDYELSPEDKEKLLNIYSIWKYDYGGRKKIVISILKKEECLPFNKIIEKTKFNNNTIEGTLYKLKKEGIITYNKEKSVWCYKK